MISQHLGVYLVNIDIYLYTSLYNISYLNILSVSIPVFSYTHNIYEYLHRSGPGRMPTHGKHGTVRETQVERLHSTCCFFVEWEGSFLFESVSRGRFWGHVWCLKTKQSW